MSSTPGSLPAEATIRCPACGKENSPSSHYCFCGHDFALPPPPPAPVGIGGWLLFFCLQMFVLNPVVIGWQVVREIAILRANGALASRVGVMIGVDSTVRLAMVALGFVCGVLLWTRHSQAVAAARAFLVVVVVGYLLLVSLPFVFSLPGTARMHVAGIYMYRAGMAVPGMIFWLLYFKHSRRVSATYGSGPSIQAAA